ncbi:hypothetical protein YC2023_085522 [Brassica napus]
MNRLMQHLFQAGISLKLVLIRHIMVASLGFGEGTITTPDPLLIIIELAGLLFSQHGFPSTTPPGFLFRTLDRGYIKSHSASLDDPFNPSQFQKCRLPSRIISNTQLNYQLDPISRRRYARIINGGLTEIYPALPASLSSSLLNCPSLVFCKLLFT